MQEIIFEIFIVFVLILLNGFFSMSGIALISVRKTRIASLVKRGSPQARIIQDFHKDPERLFATIQVGISLVTILASAFAGSSLAADLSDVLGRSSLGFIANNAYGISFFLVVACVTYVSLIIGELVPKSLGLRYAENFSLLAAYPIWGLSKISRALVKGLSLTTNLLLKPFNDVTSFTETRLSEEEIRTLIEEGQQAGTIEKDERSIIENVFESSDLTAEKIMVPHTQMVAFNINEPSETVVQKAIESGYSRLPIYKDNKNNILGILYTKKLLHNLTRNLHYSDLQKLLIPAYFVPGSMKINEVLRRLQRKKAHMALVTDEHGEIEGLVTMEDILEEIVGDIADETDESVKTISEEPDGSFMVSGSISIVDFNKSFNTRLPESHGFTTLSGFIIHSLGRFAKEGDVVPINGLEITVKEKTLRTVKTAAVKKK